MRNQFSSPVALNADSHDGPVALKQPAQDERTTQASAFAPVQPGGHSSHGPEPTAIVVIKGWYHVGGLLLGRGDAQPNAEHRASRLERKQSQRHFGARKQ